MDGKSDTAAQPNSRRTMGYDMSGELPNGAFYQIRVSGPVPAKIMRHVETLVRMTAEFLEEDEAEERAEGEAANNAQR